jgi:hypothetical protein
MLHYNFTLSLPNGYFTRDFPTKILHGFLVSPGLAKRLTELNTQNYTIVTTSIEAGILQSVSRQATGWTARVRFLARARYFSLLYSVWTGSGAHPASHPMGTRGSFSGGKAAGA